MHNIIDDEIFALMNSKCGLQVVPGCVKSRGLLCQLCSGFAIIVAEMNMKGIYKVFPVSRACHFNLSFLNWNKMNEQRRLIILIIKEVKPWSF